MNASEWCQTAVIVTLPDGSQLLLRAFGAEIDPKAITVDVRPSAPYSWRPYAGNVEIRNERGTYGNP